MLNGRSLAKISSPGILRSSHGHNCLRLLSRSKATLDSFIKYSAARRSIVTTSDLYNRAEENNKSNTTVSWSQDPKPEKSSARIENLQLWSSIDSIKRQGHRLARLDPLNLRQPEEYHDVCWNWPLIDELKSNPKLTKTKAFLNSSQQLMPINEILASVWNIYADGQCGLEFAHMTDSHEIEWLTSRWESINESFHLDDIEKQDIAKLLLECEQFDHFMAAKFPTTKRYGCEGSESMLVIIDEILKNCHLGVDATVDSAQDMTSAQISDVIIGMPHRGRLNLLACLLNFDPAAIFTKAKGQPELDLKEAWMAKCDVLSHLSTNTRFVYGLDRHHIGLSRDTPDPINVSLLPNPSHLEVVAPMAVGAARGRAHNLHHGVSSSPKFFINHEKQATQDYICHLDRVLPIQIHGDAAVAGQGIIQETMQMSKLRDFSVAGSLHIVVNNQIGFTTGPKLGRSSRYCSDIFKAIECPIIHVNAQNISGILKATRLALSYRQKFNKDVVIDLIGYRQHGHNEMDEPSFTQPVMYSNIRKRKSIPQTYCDEINLDPELKSRIVETFKEKLQGSFKKMEDFKPDNDNYRNFKLADEYFQGHICTWQTGCDIQMLKSIALDSVKLPEGFKIHSNLQRVLVDDRNSKFSVDDMNQLLETKVDWATAEILAIGSLLRQNHSVRIAGQDVARGTFSTRHAILFDQKDGSPHMPLNHMLQNGKAKLEVANTILSEEAALAYEYGYSIETCELTIWEAQFGDFFNTAQSILDTLVSSGETKWLKQSPLTILLPHGLDGAGPEHSSARIERFLQMCNSGVDTIDTEAKVNWSICFPTEPSQYFHLLRRQILRPFRKPLVILSPKIIFRHPECQSKLSDFGLNGYFKPTLNDPSVKDPNLIDKMVLCTGKIYYALKEEKLNNGLDNVAIIRIEELCPFPIQSIIDTLKMYPNVKQNNIFWFQEEHKNQGAYSFVDSRLNNLTGIRLQYIGRAESELPATGASSTHKMELSDIMKTFKDLSRH